MKKSEKPTPYIFIRAYTQSEWDSCDFALIKISRSWLDILAERLELLEPFKGKSDFYSHEYWDAPESYYIHDDDNLPTRELLEGDAFDWCYIETDPNELTRLQKPEAALSTHQLVVTGDGFGHFTAIGKHSEENYYTAEFNAAELLDDFKQEP